MGKITCTHETVHKTVDIEKKLHRLTTKDAVENIYDYDSYEYYGMSVKILNRRNDIMYDYVYDNYMNALKTIATLFDEKFDFEQIDIGLLLVNERHMQTYIHLKKANTPLMFVAKKFEHSTTNKMLTDLIDEVRSYGIGINGSISCKAVRNLCLKTHDDWEIIEN